MPFCLRKCAYCDFYSVPYEDELVAHFLRALGREIALWARKTEFRACRFCSIYFGGGTPSLLSPSHLASLIGHVRSYFSLTDDVEISLEANPATVSPSALAALREAGVNRLSLGVQSLHDEELRTLGKPHSGQQAAATFFAARQAGFDNLSVDLIFGIPEQTLGTWQTTLEEVLTWRPEHVSTYALTIEEHTPLAMAVAKGVLNLPGVEEERRMYVLAHEVLTAHGYEHYEISNYALPGRRCRHNELYWQRLPYLGLGPSAHSFASARRWWNLRNLELYCRALDRNVLPEAQSELLSLEQQRLEKVMLALRTAAGLDIRELPGGEDERFAEGVAKLSTLPGPPLLVKQGQHIRLTPHGFWLHEEVCRLLL